MHKINNYKDLPEYGKSVLVYGVGKTYSHPSFHVVAMDDLEDGLDFKENGNFYWLTEAGEAIENVRYWIELPHKPN